MPDFTAKHSYRKAFLDTDCYIRSFVPPELHHKYRTEQKLRSIMDFSILTIGMFPKGVETGLLEFHPLAMVLEYRAAAGLKTVSGVLTGNVGKAKFLNIITTVSSL
jgi:hypothetical protein